MRGILAWGTYLPYRRLNRSTIAVVAGTGGGTGTRTVASYDEDTTTMGVEAARRIESDVEPAALWFATTTPAYADKTNATAIHAALRLPRSTAAYDAVGSVRSAAAALRAGLAGTEPTLVVASDIRTGRPGGPDEAAGGDGAAALLVGDATDGPVAAEILGVGSATEEFVDRWRSPGDATSKQWEERFGETRYVPLADEAWRAALKEAGIDAAVVDHLIVAGPHGRAAVAAARKLSVDDAKVADGLGLNVGNTGAAHPALLLASVLETAEPGAIVGLVVLADGADAFVFRATDAVTAARPATSVAAQAGAGADISYGRYLAWRGFLPVEPPRRPEPARTSATAATRNADWKFGLVTPDGTTMADAAGTIVTYTIDRLAYSPSPPVVFAVVDFDSGERLPVELTDVDADRVRIGERVEMTFRRLHTTDGIHNYFWKARPER